jgi:hypothetical protein
MLALMQQDGCKTLHILLKSVIKLTQYTYSTDFDFLHGNLLKQAEEVKNYQRKIIY